MIRRAQVWTVTVVAAISACGGSAPPAEITARPVRMFVVGSGSTGGSREYAGVVEAIQSAELSFEVPGQIIDLRVLEGQPLRRGDLVARIDPTNYVADRDAAAANRLAAEADYQRYRTLYAADVVSQQELEVKRRNFQVADASFRQAQKAVHDTELRTPFAGIVAIRIVPDFANVQAKQPVVLYEDHSSFTVAFDLPERDATLTRPGLTLAEHTERTRPVVELSARPGRSFPARFREVATAADPVTRTFRITLALGAPDDVQLAPGMTARVRLSFPADDTADMMYRVPVDAVGADGAGSFVWKVIEGNPLTVARAAVETGSVVGEEMEILSGLTPGDRIAVSAVRTLAAGTPVRPLDR